MAGSTKDCYIYTTMSGSIVSSKEKETRKRRSNLYKARDNINLHKLGYCDRSAALVQGVLHLF